MALELINGKQVWRCSDGDMADEIARSVYGTASGAVEAIIEANGQLVAARGAFFMAGDLVTLPVIEAPSKRRRRLFE
jgi:phage tail protein X